MTAGQVERHGAQLTAWRCKGTRSNGHPCDKLLAEVDMDRPIYVRVVCGRCETENILVEPYRGQDAPARAMLGHP